jgi:carbon-monoxide dehydrogenase medium subunit
VPAFAKEACALLAGKKISGEVFAEAARTAAAEAEPIDDIRGTADYRRHLVEVLTHRALVGAAKEAIS